MSDLSDFEETQFEQQLVINESAKLLSVKRFLENPKQLMQKILFTSFKIQPFFPHEFHALPDAAKHNNVHKDTNNMNMIEESGFRHEKLKNDVFGFLLGSHLPTKNETRKNLPSMSDYYAAKPIIYEKYPSNPKAKCMATYLLDPRTLSQSEHRPRAMSTMGQHRVNPALATHRTKIQFSSDFQSGNLFRAYQVEYNQFDLVLQNDINTKGNNQWFFFAVKNVPKGTTLKFNIVNLTKEHSLFDFGMRPYVFSMVRQEKRKIGWVREGLKVNYQENNKFTKQHSDKPYYSLCFEYKFSYEGDVVYFSHSLPYRVSDLTSFLSHHIKDPRNSKLIKLKDLNLTLGGQDLDVIELTDETSSQKKKIVWVIARQHSGEVTSSFMMEGVIDFLLSKTSKSSELLQKYIFKIVPMVNVDGVIHGNTRAQLSGGDPNRKWKNPSKSRHPIVWALKKQIERDGSRVEMFLDLHSHSRKLGTFFYGNSFIDNKLCTRKFPWMVCRGDDRFNYNECRFTQCNYTSARHVLFESLKIPLIYTVQSSFYGYQKNDHRIIEYMPKDYREMGEQLMKSFWEYQFGKQGNNSSLADCSFTQGLVENDNVDVESIGSDSDPGEDDFREEELKGLFPAFYKVKKGKKKNIVIKKKLEKSKPAPKQQIPSIPSKPKKNDCQSHYRIYFSARNSTVEKRIAKEKLIIEKKQSGVQVCLAEPTVLRGSNNISAADLAEKRPSLCIFGQKVEEEVTVLGNAVALQVDMLKIFAQNKEQTRKNMLGKKNFKINSRISSMLQVKQNNFLNRADCHLMGTRSNSRRQR